MNSIETVGLLHPILVTSNGALVAGRRRLEACRALGWKTIPVSVTKLKGKELRLATLDEDLVRKELTVLEKAELLAERKALYLRLFPDSAAKVAGGKSRAAKKRGTAAGDIMSFAASTATTLGKSKRTIERFLRVAEQIPKDVRVRLKGSVVENRHLDLLRLAAMPETQQDAVVAALERGASGLGSAIREAVRVGARTRLPRGKYDVIVVDPPWEYGKSRTPYPTMSEEEITALPLGEVAASNCVLWLWTTNSMLVSAHRCLDAWGFTSKTMLTWVKHRPTPGNWLLSQTEHCVMAVRGNPKVLLRDQTTALHARVREHSRKPEEFYSMVEDLMPHGSRLDVFAREERKGWTAWGSETKRFSKAG